MRAKLMTSAAVLAGALAFATVGYAQSPQSQPHGGWEEDGGGDNDSHNDNSHTTDSYNSDSSLNADVDVDLDDSFNDNSDNSTNTDVDVDVADSFNDSSVNDSGNDNSKTVDIADSFNDNSDNSINIDKSTDYSKSIDIADSFNDNSVNDSFNDNSDHSTWDVRVSLNYQELYASVSDVGFDQSEEDDGRQSAGMRTGNITQDGGAFAGFAGIQTVSNNSGAASIGQAATAVSANANITFGNGGGK